jgi:Icc-related predicted phosphoesterase
MKIVCISDTHLRHVWPRPTIEIPEGDVLVHAGDATFRGNDKEVGDFAKWFDNLPHKHKVFVPGNHDIGFETQPDRYRRYFKNTHILIDQEVVIDGIKFYGSPWQPEFCDWAFNLPRGDALAEKWAMIPEDTDVLITHGPPLGIGDNVGDVYLAGERVGCDRLRTRVEEVKPQLHVFGHLHNGYGVYNQYGETVYINAAVCDEHYEPTNKPLTYEILNPRRRNNNKE